MGPRFFIVAAIVLFGGIGIVSLVKKQVATQHVQKPVVEEIRLESGGFAPSVFSPQESTREESTKQSREGEGIDFSQYPLSAELLPHNNQSDWLFSRGSRKFPFVKTITYNSRVKWKKGRPAWITDYANHFQTSRHFIARSLNGNRDYFKQDVFNGDRFNIYKPEREISFYLVVDISRSFMWLYAHDKTEDQSHLIRSYPVGLGRISPQQPSKTLTPMGKYSLGSRIAIYRPGIYGRYKGKRTEMIRTFGTRWIPFDKELENCTEPAAGYGLHGAPWIENEAGQLVEDTSSMRAYKGDGCIRVEAEALEELFAIIITKPTVIELVQSFEEAHIPGQLQPSL